MWFGMRSARLGAEVGAAWTRAEKAEGEGVSLRAEVGRLESANSALESRGIELEKDIEAARAAHEAEVRRVQDVAREQMRAVEGEKKRMQEDFAQFEVKMQQTFKNLAGDALKGSNEQFLKLAGETIAKQTQAGASDLEQRRQAIDASLKPLAEAVRATGEKIAQLDKDRVQTHASIQEQVRAMHESSAKLSEETKKLGDALRKPEVRGAYGEMQLKRVAELAGMTAYCDFSTQETVEGVDGERLRPDMVVRLPSGRTVIVDAKTNIQAYI